MTETRDSNSQNTAEATEENVRTMAEIERAAFERRTLTERVGDGFTRVIGSLGFIGLHVVGLGLWLAVNLGLAPRFHAFDPSPFGLLNLIISSEGVLLSIFVLISQNRMRRHSDHRDHLTLQISLLAEQETTKLLQEVRRISERLGLDSGGDDESHRLSQRTHLETLAEKLAESLPDP